MEITHKTRTDLKQYFATNRIPTESHFADLIDGMLNQRDDGLVKLPGKPLSLEASGDDTSAKTLLNFYQHLTDPKPSWALGLNPSHSLHIRDGEDRSRLCIEHDTGRIGIGTEAPEAALHVVGTLRVAGKIDADEILQNGQPLSASVTSSVWTEVSGGINFVGGKVVIGTASPPAELEVNGELAGNALTDRPETALVVQAPSTGGHALAHIGTVAGTGSAWNVTIDGAYLYLPYMQGLRIFDLADPANPTEAGMLETFSQAVRVTIDGDYAYVADQQRGLCIVDIADPTHPTEISHLSLSGQVKGVVVIDSYAYVAAYDQGLRIIDLTNKKAPQEIGHVDLSGYVHSVTLAGSYAYVGNDTLGLRIFDLADKTAPNEVGYVNTPGRAFSVAVVGDYAYVADDYRGLRIIDIADKATPNEVGSFAPSGQAANVAVAGDYAYVTDRTHGLRMIDISNPADPTEVMRAAPPGAAQGIAVDGTYVYVGDSQGNLSVYQIAQRPNQTHIGAHISSFTGQVGIGTATPEEQLDVAGIVKATQFSQTSSRVLKEHIEPLSLAEARATLDHLSPVKYGLKGQRQDRQHLGFIAEEMPDNLASPDRQTIVPTEIIPVLTQVVKDQQATISTLQRTVRALEQHVSQLRPAYGTRANPRTRMTRIVVTSPGGGIHGRTPDPTRWPAQPSQHGLRLFAARRDAAPRAPGRPRVDRLQYPRPRHHHLGAALLCPHRPRLPH